VQFEEDNDDDDDDDENSDDFSSSSSSSSSSENEDGIEGEERGGKFVFEPDEYDKFQSLKAEKKADEEMEGKRERLEKLYMDAVDPFACHFAPLHRSWTTLSLTKLINEQTSVDMTPLMVRWVYGRGSLFSPCFFLSSFSLRLYLSDLLFVFCFCCLFFVVRT